MNTKAISYIIASLFVLAIVAPFAIYSAGWIRIASIGGSLAGLVFLCNGVAMLWGDS